MARIGTMYTLARSTPHVQVTSTGTADVKTISVPPACSAMVVCARTNPGYLTLDNSTPSSTNGLDVFIGQPVSVPYGFYSHSGHTLKWASGVAGNAILNAMFLE